MSQKIGKVIAAPGVQHQQSPLKDNPLFNLHISKGQGNKFISHLLGLDHEHPSEAGNTTKKAALPLQGVKLSDALQGVKFTPNFMFFLLFLGFFLWLFVIYWIRHNEPLSNQVLGASKENHRSAAADRRLVAGIKNAFPVQTSATTGEIYVPNSAPAVQQANAAAQLNSNLATSPLNNQSQLSATGSHPAAFYAPAGGPTPLVFPAPATGGGATAFGAPAYAPMAPPAPAMPIATPPVVIGQGNYLVGVQSNSGTRVKTIVSR
ncbi:MAG: hypothetical protein K2X27_14355 [Candidatus Obscuribacterales bacterium]|nr:hypothetical protein [Candidatus Obscuribacterales bacterium]